MSIQKRLFSAFLSAKRVLSVELSRGIAHANFGTTRDHSSVWQRMIKLFSILRNERLWCLEEEPCGEQERIRLLVESQALCLFLYFSDGGLDGVFSFL